MKKLFLLFALLISAVQLSFADSALTSTEFYKAYLDVPIVKAAADQPNHLSEAAKAYLFDEANPLDVKLALINAVGWKFEGLTAYKDYLNYYIQHFPKKKYGIAPGKRVTQQDVFKHASPEQKAALVYLSAIKRGVLTNPSCLFARNANNTKLSLCFARKDFNLLPNGVLVLQRKDMAHFFAGVAIYHDETPSARKEKVEYHYGTRPLNYLVGR